MTFQLCHGRPQSSFDWPHTAGQLKAAGMLSQTDDASITIYAPAKVNLFLEVHGRRADGFHELVTLMTTINLCDTLWLRRKDDGQIAVGTSWATGVVASGNAAMFGELPKEEENLVTRALTRLQQVSGCESGVDVQLTKRIPAGAGLGGASSDAAAALMAASRLWGLGYSPQQLRELAAELGSDVPFFIRESPDTLNHAAICRGRGEQIERCLLGAGLHMVVARPPVSLSTAAVYQRCRAAESPRAVEPMVDALRRRSPEAIRAAMTNRLMPPAAELTPWISRLEEEFTQQDCWASQMTGSGSCYFGLFASALTARRAASRLRSRGLEWVWATQAC